MDLIPLYKIQRVLDERIAKENNITEEVTELKICAFKVELAELAQEIKFFKFWSKKPMSPREVILEEFVDGIHFLLGISLDRKWDRFISEVGTGLSTVKSLAELFNELFEAGFSSSGQWKRMFMNYLAVGKKLGFSEAEIVAAYMAKNEKNHARQDTGVY